MSSLAQIRTALKTTITAAISGLTGYDTVPGSPNLPAVAVVPVPDENGFTVAMGRGADRWQFDVIVLVSAGDEGVGQQQLDSYVTGAGSASIRQAIFAARTLGLGDCDAVCTGLSGYNLGYTVVSIDHMAASLRVVVHTTGTA